MAKTKLIEKIGYGFGDMSSSMFWKIFSYYLPFFYSNIFGLSLVDAGVLVLVTRIWDAVSDPMMGVISDRTNTRWGKYRPYLLWVAPLFSICGILLFTTPDLNYGGKLIWAYVTYILMMTVYTGINVPYGAMLGVMTDDSNEKTVFSSFRMFFAYGGSFISLFLWEPLTNLMGGYDTAGGWFWAMVVIAAACFVMFLLCFFLTKEHLKTVSTVSVGNDFKALLSNKPWWLLIGAALCFNLFNTVRGATVAYFFQDIIGPDVNLAFFAITFAFYAGLFLGIGEVSNMVGVASCVPIANRLGKKTTFIIGQRIAGSAERSVLLHPLHAHGLLGDADVPGCHLYPDGYHVAAGMVDVCRRERLCRAEVPYGFYGPDLLQFVDGAEVWRCHRWCCCAVAAFRLWLCDRPRTVEGRCGAA